MERETMLHLERVELQSIIGLLQHVSCIVKPGRTFLWRMIALLPVAKKPHHRIRLNAGFRSDLIWWAIFLPRWNGTGMMDRVTRKGRAATITHQMPQARGAVEPTQQKWNGSSWGGPQHAERCTSQWGAPSIILVMAIWGQQWTGQAVRCRCDKAAVVAIVNSESSKEDKAMHLMRSAAFFMAKHQAESLGGTHTGNGKPKCRCNIQKWPPLLSIAESSSSPNPNGSTSGTHPNTASSTSGLDLNKLDSVQSLFLRGLTDSTQQVYRSGQRSYMRFCTEVWLVAVPGTERTLTYVVAHLVKKGLRLRTIKVYLSAVWCPALARGSWTNTFFLLLGSLILLSYGMEKSLRR